MKLSILLGALALLTACGSSHKAVETHSVEKYHQQVTASVRVADSLWRHRALVIDSPVIEIEQPADSVSPPRKVRIAARRAFLADETTATTAVATSTTATTVVDNKVATKQAASRSPWLIPAIVFFAVFLLLRKFR